MRITEEELRRNLAALLEKVRDGSEVIVLQGGHPSVRLSSARVGRTIDEMLALLPKDSDAVIDDAFARDILDGINGHREPLDSSRWD